MRSDGGGDAAGRSLKEQTGPTEALQGVTGTAENQGARLPCALATQTQGYPAAPFQRGQKPDHQVSVQLFRT